MKFTLLSTIALCALPIFGHPLKTRRSVCAPSGAAASTGAAQGGNLQPFTGNLGVAATPVVDSGNPDRPFAVKGDTFVNIAAALQRSCDQQFNGCANAANAGGQSFSVSDCQAQKDECTAADAGVQA